MFSSVESRQPIKGVRAQNFSGELGLFTQGRRAVLYFGFTSLVSSATSKETFDSMGRMHQALQPGMSPVYPQDSLRRLDGMWHCMARKLDRFFVVTYIGLRTILHLHMIGIGRCTSIRIMI
jgi:hypothetical protein